MTPLFLSPEVPSFSLPLDRTEFVRALRCGLGRALLHAQAHGVSDRMDDFLHACLHNVCYDSQVEESRADWLLEIAGAAGVEREVAARVIESRDTSIGASRGHWDQFQRARLLRLLAERGYAGARERLFELFAAEDFSRGIIACEDIVRLDGADGLRFVCERLGPMLRSDPALREKICVSQPVDDFDVLHGEGAALSTLEAIRASNPAVDEYLKCVAHRDEGDEEEEKEGQAGTEESATGVEEPAASVRRSRWWNVKNWSVSDVIREIESAGPAENRFLTRSWGRTASENDLPVIIAKMLEETNPGRIAKYLRAFARRQLPFLDSRILAFADHEDFHVRWATYLALRNLKSGSVRELALRRMAERRILEGEIELFRKNYEPGDAERIKTALFLPDDEVPLHGVIFNLLAVLEDNPAPDCQDLMLFAYEHTPCSMCRYTAAKLMASSDVIPQWILEECRFDCDETTRQFAADYVRQS